MGLLRAIKAPLHESGDRWEMFFKKQASDFIKKMPTARQKVHEREKQKKKKGRLVIHKGISL